MGWVTPVAPASEKGKLVIRSQRNTVVVNGTLYTPTSVGNNPSRPARPSHPNRNAFVVGRVLYNSGSVTPLVNHYSHPNRNAFVVGRVLYNSGSVTPLINHFFQPNRNTSVIDRILYTPNHPPYQIPMSGPSSNLAQLATRTRIEWLSSLDTEARPSKNYRRTSIICTIGELQLF